MDDLKPKNEGSDLPAGLSRPAIRALAGAGYTRLEQLTRATADELLALHGFGPNGLARIREALAARGLALKGENP